ncbi:DUF1932 domain-containing protein [Sphingobium sp. DEHP117]|uniref:NAD(P)-dependent oxidoreductase n=1 Tax=Sphingobium sp. DEHP117 TaxID=2993436 RepID=UPI0027D52DAC|nr:DUF1932 domain-containing protein [Sphingobium sp. DEHP117]MDQ4420138.1 DUF1932 domain-containing protein [Sphingobium sp. DEHP117]
MTTQRFQFPDHAGSPQNDGMMLAVIGYGEAGSAFAIAGAWGNHARGWDLKDDRRAAMVVDGLPVSRSAQEALAHARLVLSLVTATSAYEAARDYAPLLAPGAIWCDMNSVAPETKRAAAAMIEAAGAHYVDAAVLAPVHPARLSVPLLLSGEASAQAELLLRQAGFETISIAGNDIGRASAIKLLRSVMVKGLEALTAEMLLGANALGVTDAVLASLDASERRDSWFDRAAYNIERMATHGVRRAAEMEEAVSMLRDIGVEPIMTTGTVRRQQMQAGKPIASPNEGEHGS